jgi:hypothetical protein|uniref:Uncharacterized protein n=1 Tax=viral metagenome TaxID=1070528 RepID=A0A6C0CD79_9ZZZZ
MPSPPNSSGRLSTFNASRTLMDSFNASPLSLYSKSKKNRVATKIQSAFRGRRTRRQFTAKKQQQALTHKQIEDEAERLFGKANKSKAKQAIIDMGRDVDQERIEYMIGELFIELKHENPKIYASWLAKAKKKLSK